MASNMADFPLPTGPNIPNNLAATSGWKSIVWEFV
jgi:hypothetical protein